MSSLCGVTCPEAYMSVARQTKLLQQFLSLGASWGCSRTSAMQRLLSASSTSFILKTRLCPYTAGKRPLQILMHSSSTEQPCKLQSHGLKAWWPSSLHCWMISPDRGYVNPHFREGSTFQADSSHSLASYDILSIILFPFRGLKSLPATRILILQSFLLFF